MTSGLSKEKKPEKSASDTVKKGDDGGGAEPAPDRPGDGIRRSRGNDPFVFILEDHGWELLVT